MKKAVSPLKLIRPLSQSLGQFIFLSETYHPDFCGDGSVGRKKPSGGASKEMGWDNDTKGGEEEMKNWPIFLI